MTSGFDFDTTAEVTKMGFTTARINAAVDAALATASYAQLHTGAPGSAGTANVAAGVARAALTKGAAGAQTAKVASCTCTFVVPGAGGPFTHISLWEAETGGVFVGDAPTLTQETFQGQGSLGVRIDTVGSSPT